MEEPSQEPYQSELAGLNHTGIHIGRFRANGGSTTRWGGQILELDEIDFTRREGVAGSGWPFPKSELTPHYARAIELEGLSRAVLDDNAVWRQIGLTPPKFDSLDTVLSRWCPEPNFARLHREMLEQNPAVTVWLHANAVDIGWEGARLRSVRCRALNGIEATFTADEFVFCLGGIESSRFFLQPRAAGGPWLRSGLLGRYFQDHIVANGAVIEMRNPYAFHSVFDNVFSRGFKYQPKIQLSPAQQASLGTLNVAASVAFLGDTEQELVRLKEIAKRIARGHWRETSFHDLLHAVRHSPLLAKQVYRYSAKHRAYNPTGSNSRIELLLHCEQEPESESTITLSDQRDSLGMFRTRLDWRVSERELYSMRTLVEVAERSLTNIARVIPDPELAALDPNFMLRCGDGYHHMGGMRMSTSWTMASSIPICVCMAWRTATFAAAPSSPVRATPTQPTRCSHWQSDCRTPKLRLSSGSMTLQTIPLGKSGRQTDATRIWWLQPWVRSVAADSLAILEAAWDAGIRHFDVAPMYGYGEAGRYCMGEFQKRHRGEATVTTKYGNPAGTASAAQASRPLCGAPYHAKLSRHQATTGRRSRSSRWLPGAARDLHGGRG